LITQDSIVFLKGGEKVLTFFSNNNLFEYKIEDSIPTLKYDYETSSFLFYPLTIFNYEILVYNSPLEVLKSRERLNKYYSLPRNTHLKFIDGKVKVTKLSGLFPKYYNINNYHIFYPVRTLSKDKIIYSFDDSKNIFVYDPATENYQEIELKTPDFTPNDTFDLSRSMDRFYVEKYYYENDRFANFLYDEYRNQYYRTLGKAIKFQKGDGTLDKGKPFIVLVYDSLFNFKKEIVFPANEYNFQTLYCTKDLVYFTTENNKHESFHGFDFK
jgi:hypothetical protein